MDEEVHKVKDDVTSSHGWEVEWRVGTGGCANVSSSRGCRGGNARDRGGDGNDREVMDMVREVMDMVGEVMDMVGEVMDMVREVMDRVGKVIDMAGKWWTFYAPNFTPQILHQFFLPQIFAHYFYEQVYIEEEFIGPKLIDPKLTTRLYTSSQLCNLIRANLWSKILLSWCQPG